MLVLYRKYRPKNFSEVVGQEAVLRILKNALIYERISHAYLFCGPRGVGKTTVARILAKALNCEKRAKNSPEPCNSCFSCQEINEGKSMDLLEIDAASNRGIAEIRDLREKVKFAPTRGKYKVFIIDEVHMLTTEAFNALLKTLEEPPRHCIFILATTAPFKVPATILSRCQRFDFRRLPRFVLEEQLKEIAKKEKVKIEKAAYTLIAKEAQGSSRDALTIFGQIITLADTDREITYQEVKEILGVSDFTKIVELVDFMAKKEIKKALRLVNELVEAGEDLNQFTKEFLEYLRKLLLLKVDLNFNKLPELNFTPEELNTAQRQIAAMTEKDLIKLISGVLKAKKEVEISNLPQLPLELAILESQEDLKEANYQANGGGMNFEKRTKDFSSTKGEEAKKEKNQSSFSPKIDDSFLPDLENKNSNHKNTSITFSEIQKNWFKVQELAHKKNFSLSVFLRSSLPFAFRDGCLILACRYALHKERLEETKTKILLEEILSQVMQEKIFVKCCLKTDLPKRQYISSTSENSNFSLKSEKDNSAENENSDLSFSERKKSSSSGLINLATEIFGEES